MNIPKAIQILNDRLTQGRSIEGPDLLDAIKLGTEALEEIHSLRTLHDRLLLNRLPSETED